MAFYDGLGKKIQKTGQDALEKTKGVAETAKLNAVISDLEKEINTTFSDLGKAYYNKHAQNPEDQELLPYFRKIEDRMAQIQRNRDKIRALKGLTKCIHCGQDIELNAVFCNHCGQRQVEAANVGQTVSRCPNCGAPIAAGQLFCTGCGQRVEPVQQAQEKRFCLNCGQELAPGAVFCTRCGQRNQEGQSAPAGGMNAEISAEMMGAGQAAPEPDYYAGNMQQEPAAADMPPQAEPDMFAEEPCAAEEPQPELYSAEPDMAEPAVSTDGFDDGDQITGIPESAAEQSAQAAVFCTNCGSQLEPDEIFCSNCGTRVR
ncbi:MAG: zinc ribbon domain-containing protein [Clostridiales bacterium]|nr:zinc ribbon domain-containing protein [Clostridiales bacterium]